MEANTAEELFKILTRCHPNVRLEVRLLHQDAGPALPEVLCDQCGPANLLVVFVDSEPHLLPGSVWTAPPPDEVPPALATSRVLRELALEGR
jgi:hypothetical protein